LTPERIEIVQSTWTKAKILGYERIGDEVFQNLFALDPSLKRFMSFGDDPNYRQSESYVNHNVRFITTLNTGV